MQCIEYNLKRIISKKENSTRKIRMLFTYLNISLNYYIWLSAVGPYKPGTLFPVALR